MSKAEALGYVSSFVVEHHFTGFGQISATLNSIDVGRRAHQDVAARYRRDHLALAQPVLLAEQIATMDLLSGGRIDFGIGQGYRHNEFAGFCIPMEEADQRFDECLEVMLKAWTSDRPWSHRGKYFQFDNVVVEPPTAQKPHPPLWMGAGRPQSIKKVAELGYNLLLDQFASIEQIGERIALFKAEVEARGRRFDPTQVAVTRSVNVVKTAAERQKALETRMAARERVHNLAQRPDGQNNSTIMTYAHTLEAAEAGALYGTPDEIAVKLQRLRDLGPSTCCSTARAGSRPCAASPRRCGPRSPGSPAPLGIGEDGVAMDRSDARATNAYWGRDGIERTILDALAAAGKNTDTLTVDDLAPADQFHSGGKGATERLARMAQLRRVCGSSTSAAGWAGPRGPWRPSTAVGSPWWISRNRT